MHALRDSPIRRLPAALAGLALYLQLAFAGPGMLAVAVPAGPTGLFAEHALCLAGGEQQPATPDDGAPSAPHAHDPFCCLFHAIPALTPQAAAPPVPVSYAVLKRQGPADIVFVPAPQYGSVNARAPPTLA